MDQYRAYLRAELAKLRNIGDGERFLATAGCPLAGFGSSMDAVELAQTLRSQEVVDWFGKSRPRGTDRDDRLLRTVASEQHRA